MAWFANSVSVAAALLCLAGALAMWRVLPSLHEQGFGAYPIIAFAVIGVALSATEFATRGHHLSSLALAFIVLTALAGVVGFSMGVSNSARATVEGRAVMLVGLWESLGNVVAGCGLAMLQTVLWAIARRRALRAG